MDRMLGIGCIAEEDHSRFDQFNVGVWRENVCGK